MADFDLDQALRSLAKDAAERSTLDDPAGARRRGTRRRTTKAVGATLSVVLLAGGGFAVLTNLPQSRTSVGGPAPSGATSAASVAATPDEAVRSLEQAGSGTVTLSSGIVTSWVTTKDIKAWTRAAVLPATPPADCTTAAANGRSDARTCVTPDGRHWSYCLIDGDGSPSSGLETRDFVCAIDFFGKRYAQVTGGTYDAVRVSPVVPYAMVDDSGREWLRLTPGRVNVGDSAATYQLRGADTYLIGGLTSADTSYTSVDKDGTALGEVTPAQLYY